MTYKVGQIVRNRKLGIGKVLQVSGDDVLTYFKDEQINPRSINVSVVPMEIPSDQSDAFFDGLSDAALNRLWKRPKARTAARKPRAPKAAAVESSED